MPNPRRTTTPRKKRRRNEHIASTEIRQQARQSGAKAAKTVAKTVAKAVTHTPQATQTSVQPRNTVSRPTTSTQKKSGSNVPKTAATNLRKANAQAKKFQPRVKITNTSAKSQYSDFKKSGLTYKTQEERKKQKIDYAKAYQKGKDITYLGTKQKKETTKFKDEEGKTQKLKSVNALTKGEFNRMTEASRINNKKLGNLQLKGGKGRGKDIREKVGSKTAQSALKGKFATGAMQGLSYVDVFSGVGKYNKTAKKAIKKTKNSGAYMAGYGVGMAGQFALGGTNALGKSIAKTGGKVAAKSAGKKFLRNRAGELVAETPTNLVDAAKMSMDENGKIDKKEFAKWMAINTGFTGGMGGAMEGIGGAITKSQGKKLVKLAAKSRAGNLTEAEKGEYDKLVQKLKSKAKNKESISSNIANNRRVKSVIDSDTAEKTAARARETFENNASSTRARVNATKEANASADKVTEQARKTFDTTTENRRAKVAAQKEYDKKAVHLENNVKQAKKTRDTLKESVDDLKALRKKDGTMAGHQQIINKYGSVEKLDAVISRTESALKTSRKRLREVQTNLGTEKKRLQRANAKIDKEFPVEAKAETPYQKTAEGKAGYKAEQKETHELQTRLKELNDKNKKMGLTTYEEQEAREIQEKLGRIGKKGETKVEVKEVKAAISETKPETTGNRKIEIDDEGGLVLRDENGNRQPLDQESVDNLNRLVAERTESANKAADLAIEVKRAEKKKNDAWKLYEQNKKAFVARDKETTSLERFQEWQKELNGQYLAYDKAKLSHDKLKQELDLAKKNVDTVETLLQDEQRRIESGGFRAVGEDDVKIKGEVKAGNRSVAQDSKEVADTVSKTTKEAEPPKSLPKETDPNFRERGITYRIRRALFNDLASLDDVFLKTSTETKGRGNAQVNALRMAKSSASAKVSEGRELFSKFGLTKKANKQKMNEFQEYAWLKHDLEIFDNDPAKEFLGFHNYGNKLEDSRAAIVNRINELEGKYGNKVEFVDPKTGKKEIITEVEAFQRGLVKYFDDLLQMEVDAGLTSKDFAKALRGKYKNYVPKFVAKEFDDTVTKTFKDEFDIAKGMREAKGGKAEEGLVPMYEQMIAKTNAVYKRTELNRTAKAMAEVWGVSPEQLDMVKEAAKASDVDVAESVMDCAVFTPKPKNGQYKIWYYVNGDRHELPVSKEMSEEIRNWTGEQKMMLIKGTLGKVLDTINDKAVAKVARVWKDFITDYSLVFGIKNHARDIETALFYTKDLKGYMRNLPTAYATVLTPKAGRDEFQQFMLDAYKKNGGVHSQLVTSGKFDTKFYESAFKRAGNLNPLNAIKEINSAAETIPRYAEFLSAMESHIAKKSGKNVRKMPKEEYQRLMKEAMNDHDAVANAMYRAKDVTLNFDRGGWLGKKFNRGIVPFFNPSVQGLSKLSRELTVNNIKRGAGGALNIGGTALGFGLEATKLGLMVAAPATLLNLRYGDYYEGKVDGYGALSDYNKYTNYNIPVGDGKYIKIPRARELASMQDAIDWGFHHIKYGDGQTPGSPVFVDTKWNDIKNLGSISWQQIGPVNPLEDNLLMPGYRAIKGKTWFGGYIETFEDQEKIDAGKSEDVWDENTSELAKILGKTDAMKKFNISPKKIDNALDGYLGIIHDMGLSQTSAKNKIKYQQGYEENGVLGGILAFGKSTFATNFMIDSVFQNRYKSDNYNRKTILTNEIEELEADKQKYTKKWYEARAKLNRINNAYSYNGIQFDESSAQIYLSNTLSAKDKAKATRELAQSQTNMWKNQAEGKVTSPVDPLAVLYKMRDSKGNKILPVETMLRACSYSSKDDFGNETNNIMDAYEDYKGKGGKNGKFMKVVLASREINRSAGASTTFLNWRTNAFAVALNGIKDADKVLASFGDEKGWNTKDANSYMQYGGNLKSYKKSSKDITQGAYDLGLDYASQMEQWDKANSLSAKKNIDREYFAQSQFHSGKDGTYYGYDAFVIKNAARCLASDKYKKNWHGDPSEKVNLFCLANKFSYKDGKKPDPVKVEAAIRKEFGKGYTDEERAAVFYEICPWGENPFGDIGDYSLKGDTGINPSSGYGGGGRGRRRGRGGRGRGGSGGGSGKGNAVAMPTATKMGKYKVHDFTFKSNVNDAYRKKVKKAREDLRKNTSKANK